MTFRIHCHVKRPPSFTHRVSARHRNICRVVALSLFGLLSLCWATASPNKAVAEEFLIGAPFQKAIDQSAGRSWSGDSLRDALQELSQTKKVSILLDRRIDPTQELKLSRANIALRDLIAAVADSVGAGSTVVGNVVYVGPKPSAERLPLLIKLRSQELTQLAAVKSATANKDSKEAKSPWQTRAGKLKEQHTLSWADFDQPRELLHQLETQHQFEIEQLDQVSHDLWVGNSLPHVNTIEGLSLVLIQFGSTFQFVPDRRAIRIVPLRDEEAIVEILKQPRSGSTIRPPLKKPATKSDKSELSPLSRKHSLTVKNASLLEVMKTFEGTGVRFDYNREQLETAKISLDQKVDIDVKGITAEAIFRQLLEPLELEVSAEGNTLRLSPKKP